jgi:hypothetical protein
MDCVDSLQLQGFAPVRPTVEQQLDRLPNEKDLGLHTKVSCWCQSIALLAHRVHDDCICSALRAAAFSIRHLSLWPVQELLHSTAATAGCCWCSSVSAVGLE